MVVILMIMIILWLRYEKLCGLPDCLLLYQIPIKAIPGLFNNFTELLMLNNKKSKYMRVNLVQLK